MSKYKESLSKEYICVFSIFKKYFYSWKGKFTHDFIIEGLIAIYNIKAQYNQINHPDDYMYYWSKAVRQAMYRLRGYILRTKYITLNASLKDSKMTMQDIIPDKTKIDDNLDMPYLKQKIKNILNTFEPQQQKILACYFISQSRTQTSQKYKISIFDLKKLIDEYRNRLQEKLQSEKYFETNNFAEAREKAEQQKKSERRKATSSKHYYKAICQTLNCTKTEYVISQQQIKAEREKNRQNAKKYNVKYSTYMEYLSNARAQKIDIETYIKNKIKKTVFENLLFEKQISESEISNILKLDKETVHKKIIHDRNKFFLYEIVKIKNSLFPEYKLKNLVGEVC